MRHLSKTLVSILLLLPITAFAQLSVTGPDGKLRVEFLLDDGKPVYNVYYNEQQVLNESPLGFIANIGDLSQGLTQEGFEEQHITDSYTMNRIKKSAVDVDANELIVNLKNAKEQKYSIQFRVEKNDIAFRYLIPNEKDKKNDKKFSIRIMQEKTGFRLPKGTTTFICPQSDAMIGWKGTKPSYEEEYKFDEPMESISKYGHGYTFPCLFKTPSSSKNGENNWVLISETGTDSRYCGCRLSDCKDGGLYTVEFPMPEENNGNGTIEPAFALPGATPWRTITVGSTLNPIVETTIPWDFVEPRFKTTNSYKFGKGTWSWIVWQDNSICWDDQVKYIALAKSMGYQYVLIDNWWDNNIGKEKMSELVKYAQTQGVDVFLWYSSSGWWNDIEQGPINIMCDPIRRKEYMRWMQNIGVKGIKVDFFGGDKQETMRLYEQILSDADDYGLMVIFHGCTLPRGWERMYPNYVGSEAVLASENIYFEQHFCDVEAQNTALHPFVRNTVGCMEFGGCFMNRTLNKGNDPTKKGNKRVTTDCHELATTVLFQNPIQNFALTPENINGDRQAPTICMDYLREVPTTWDETVYLDGYPGKYCVLARRSGEDWYIAGNNATGKELTLNLSLPMFQKGLTGSFYHDNLKTREPEKQTVISKGKTFTVTMADKGGFVLVVKAKKLVVIGDSYVANHKRPQSETWHYKLAEELGLTYKNYGRNGACVAFDRTHDGRFNFGPAIYTKTPMLDSDADYVIIIAGHNDASKIGTSKDSLEMFRDSLDFFLTSIGKQCPKAKVGYVTPWNVDRPGFAQMCSVIKEVCRRHSIPVLDNYSPSCIINPNDADFRKQYFQGQDDTAHLNDSGHNLFLSVGKKWFQSKVEI